MPGVPRNLIEHSLNVDPKAIPKRQHLRRFTDDRWDAIKKELAKLLAAGFIREVFHPEWLANPILVRKKNTNEWRMCVDYTDLNNHYPKDPFGLPRIDQVINSTAGCDLLCFLDFYSGYHQIAIKEEDQEKTVFITPFGAYCYTIMSFGMKNAGTTFQRAIQACFKRQLNKNIEAYVDDVVVKTRNSDTLIADLEETFASLWEYRWKLNPNKCVFGVPSGKLLGFITNHRGIEANPEKISAIKHWVMYFDSSLKLEGAGAGVLLISPTGKQLKYVLQIFWKVSNNEAEYEALLHWLRLAISLGIKRLIVYGDSAVVINQVNNSWDHNKENMDAYCLEVRKLENKFYGLEFHHVVRDNNVAADVLSKLGSTRAQVPAGVFVHELHAPSIPEPAPTTTDAAPSQASQEVMMIDVDWRQPFIDYIREQKFPTDKNLAEQIIHRAKSYVLVGDKLYRRGTTSGVLMKCVPREEGKDIL
jgi:ribonuclease HI